MADSTNEVPKEGPTQEEMAAWIESVRPTGSATFEPKTPQIDPFQDDRPGGGKEQTPISTAQVLNMANDGPSRPLVDWRDFYDGELDSDDSSVSSGSLSDFDAGSLLLRMKDPVGGKKRLAKKKAKKNPKKNPEKNSKKT